MSEDSQKPPSINLEELERQLREALSRRSASTDTQNAAGSNEDPLSMLARLVEYEGAGKQAADPHLAAHEPAHDLQSHAAPAAHRQDVPVQPAYESGLPDRPVHTESSHQTYQPPAPWQAREEHTAPETVAPTPSYQTPQYQPHDHLVFDAGQYQPVETPSAYQPAAYQPPASYAAPEPVQPPAPGQPDYQPSAYYGMGSEPGHAATPDPVAPVDPYGSASAYRSEPLSRPRDSFSQPQPAASAYEASYDPQGTGSPTHDVLSMSPSEIRPAAEATSSGLNYGKERPLSGDRLVSPYASSYDTTPPAQPDKAQIYAAAFPDRGGSNDQWPANPAAGVGLSYSEAEANLGTEQRPPEQPAKGQGRGMMILLGLVVVAVGGFGLAAYLRNEGARVPSGAPPVIVADKNPVKVVPTNPGGTEVPNQGAAIYQPSKAEDAKDAKVVSTDEKPVDISQAPRPAGSPLIGEPKKIRTVTVRPDGSLVEESTVAAGSAIPNSAAVPRAAPSMVSISPPPAAAPAPAPAPAPPVAQPAQPAPQVTANATAVRVLPPVRPQAPEPTPAPAQAAPRPATTPVPPTPAPAASESTERAANGEYGVQFSAPGTEAEARNAIAALKRSYASILDGMTLSAQKAENAGRTIFRVRAIGLSREEAISVCEKIKSSGGQCFVAKN